MTKTKIDPYEFVTNTIIEQIESGMVDGKPKGSPWRLAAGAGMPHNAVGKRAYRGVNVLLLWGTAMVNDYPTNEWATYKQWKSVDAQVRGGEEGTFVTLWKEFRTEPNEGETPDEDGKVKRMWMRLFKVFNAAQVDGWETPTEPEVDPVELDERIESWVGATGARIKWNDGERAAYSPSRDVIVMPRVELFKGPTFFYSTRFHELGHWTGAEKRLDRDLSKRFGTSAYAAEELIAELTAAFACGRFGLEAEPTPDHADYIANWLTLLRSDNKAIVTAASKASDAMEFMESAALAGGYAEREMVAA